MKLLFRQRAFSWFDSYDIYDENENTVYVVKGQLSWGHCLKIYDPADDLRKAASQGNIFSSSVPGKKPMLSAISGVLRVTMMRS